MTYGAIWPSRKDAHVVCGCCCCCCCRCCWGSAVRGSVAASVVWHLELWEGRRLHAACDC
jgi:hypothetical protein